MQTITRYHIDATECESPDCHRQHDAGRIPNHERVPSNALFDAHVDEARHWFEAAKAVADSGPRSWVAEYTALAAVALCRATTVAVHSVRIRDEDDEHLYARMTIVQEITLELDVFCRAHDVHGLRP